MTTTLDNVAAADAVTMALAYANAVAAAEVLADHHLCQLPIWLILRCDEGR